MLCRRTNKVLVDMLGHLLRLPVLKPLPSRGTLLEPTLIIRFLTQICSTIPRSGIACTHGVFGIGFIATRHGNLVCQKVSVNKVMLLSLAYFFCIAFEIVYLFEGLRNVLLSEDLLLDFLLCGCLFI